MIFFLWGHKYPKKIVKYFNKNHISDIRNGRFRLGTTITYCADETQQTKAAGVLSDDTEGAVFLDFKLSSSPVIFFNTPIIFAARSNPPNINVKFRMHCNDHIFCASLGEYDPLHHRSMIDGVKIDNKFSYLPNPDYTMFCEIDLKRFVRAMRSAIYVESKLYGTGMPQDLYAAVRYDDDSKTILFRGKYPKYFDYREYKEMHYLNSSFTKPRNFLIEREFRFIASFFEPGNTPHTESAKFLQSRALQESIIRIGEI